MSAKDTWSAIRSVEDLFAVLVKGYSEIEKYLLTQAVDFELDIHRFEQGEMFDDFRDQMNLLLGAFLNAARAYYEQTIQRLSDVGLVSVKDVKAVFSLAFDGSFEYRVMDALRNHSLHLQAPISGFTISGGNEWKDDIADEGVPKRRSVIIDPYVKKLDLINSKKINSSTRAEISSIEEEQLDLKFLLRGYVAQLAICQKTIRDLTSEPLELALELMEQAENKLCVSAKHKCKFVHASLLSDGSIKHKIYISLEHHEKLRKQRKRWSNLQYLHRVFFSSEINQAKEKYPQHHDEVWIK